MIVANVSGGLDQCFGGQKSFAVEVEQEEMTVGELIVELKHKYVKSKAEFFVKDEELKAGILVLINDTDWELEGKEEAVLTHKDQVCLISTLHGG